MATKKTTKKSYASVPSKYRSAKGRPKPAKKAGKKGGGGPAEEPIIVGGGSVYLQFEKKFKVKPHATKHRFEHEDSPSLTRVDILSSTGTVKETVPLTATDVVKIYHTRARGFNR